MKFPCPHCGQRIEASEEWFGEKTNCPGCTRELLVPVPQEFQAQNNEASVDAQPVVVPPKAQVEETVSTDRESASAVKSHSSWEEYRSSLISEFQPKNLPHLDASRILKGRLRLLWTSIWEPAAALGIILIGVSFAFGIVSAANDLLPGQAGKSITPVLLVVAVAVVGGAVKFFGLMLLYLPYRVATATWRAAEDVKRSSPKTTILTFLKNLKPEIDAGESHFANACLIPDLRKNERTEALKPIFEFAESQRVDDLNKITGLSISRLDHGVCSAKFRWLRSDSKRINAIPLIEWTLIQFKRNWYLSDISLPVSKKAKVNVMKSGQIHETEECPRGHGPLGDWQGKARCWTCGWPDK